MSKPKHQCDKELRLGKFWAMGTQTDSILSLYELMATTGGRGRSQELCVNPLELRLLQVGEGDLDPGVSSLWMLQALRISFRKAGEGFERGKEFVRTQQVFF